MPGRGWSAATGTNLPPCEDAGRTNPMRQSRFDAAQTALRGLFMAAVRLLPPSPDVMAALVGVEVPSVAGLPCHTAIVPANGAARGAERMSAKSLHRAAASG